MKTNVVSRVVAVIGLVLLLVPMAPAGNGPGGAPSNLPASPGPLTCRIIDGADLGIAVTLADSYGTRVARVRTGRLLCSSVTVTVLPGEPLPFNPPVADVNALRCYSLSNVSQGGLSATPSPDPAVVTDGFVNNEGVTVGAAQYLCSPAVVD